MLGGDVPLVFIMLERRGMSSSSVYSGRGTSGYSDGEWAIASPAWTCDFERRRKQPSPGRRTRGNSVKRTFTHVHII